MITYQQLLENKTAFAKATTTKPNIFKIGEKFAILGTAGIYQIEVIPAGAGYSIDCSCPAGKHSKVCYHAAAALIAQLTEEADKARAKRERMQTKPLPAAAIKFLGAAAAADAAAEREQERRDIEEAEAKFYASYEYRTDYSIVLDDPRSADFHFTN